MKLAIRIFALSVVFAGVAAASVSSNYSHALPSHQSATANLPAPSTERLPIPTCGPHVPTCSAPSGGY